MRYRAANGDWVSLDLAFEWQHPPTSHAKFPLKARDVQWSTSTDKSFAESMAKEVAEVELDRRLDVDGRAFRFGQRQNTNDGEVYVVVAWEGGSLGSAYCFLAGLTMNVDVGIAVASAFDFSSQSDGTWVVPRVQLASAPVETQMTFAARDLGILAVKPLTPDVALQLPNWAGTSGSSGEVFEVRDPYPMLVHVAPSAVTELLPIGGDVTAAQIQLMLDMSVAWKTNGS